MDRNRDQVYHLYFLRYATTEASSASRISHSLQSRAAHPLRRSKQPLNPNRSYSSNTHNSTKKYGHIPQNFSHPHQLNHPYLRLEVSPKVYVGHLSIRDLLS